jgi:hypothetical protein
MCVEARQAVAATKASLLYFRYSIETKGRYALPDISLASPEKSEQTSDSIRTHNSLIHQVRDQ